MRRKQTVVGLLSLILVLALSVVTEGQKRPRPPAVPAIPLEATFDPAITGIMADGSYRTIAGGSCNRVEITADGDLVFDFDPRSGRAIFFDFTRVLRLGPGDVQPESSNEAVPGPGDPVTAWTFRTMQIGAAPTLNLRTMAPGQVSAVRLFFSFTAVNSGDRFWLSGAPNTWPGVVQVTALSTDGDAVVDCWVFEPLPSTYSAFRLDRKVAGPRGSTIEQDFGDFELPFRFAFCKTAPR